MNGVKGPSWLSTVADFDVMDSSSFDYMHCVLLNLCRCLLQLWFQSVNSSEIRYIGNSVQLVDEKIRPPCEIQQTP